MDGSRNESRVFVRAPHLPALTGLRFFAACAIMVLHGIDAWPLPSFITELSLNQGVSFFFVLSGFILTYVYRDLSANGAVKEFYVHRIARIWPVHIAATLLLFVLVPGKLWSLLYAGGLLEGLTYVTLTHAWVPLWRFFLNLNGVSWTISVEMFFYLLFPLFLVAWGRYEKTKLFVAAVPAIGIIAFANAINAPNADWAPGLTRHGLIYFSPLSRLFEFVCGIVAAKVWMSRHAGRPFKVVTSIGLEFVAIVAVYSAVLYCRHPLVSDFFRSIGGAAGAHWINVNGFTPAFVFLIYVFASSSGPVARIVSSRPLVFLGEISFSLYMVHTIVLTVFRQHENTVAAIAYSPMVAYWGFSLLTAFCMWSFIEKPFRKAIVGAYQGRPELLRRIAIYVRRLLPKVVLAGLVSLFGFIILFPRPEIKFATAPEIAALKFKPQGLVAFGGRYEFLGANPISYGNQTLVDVYFRAKAEVRLEQSVALHALGLAGEIAGSAAAKLDVADSVVPAGTVWRSRLIFVNGRFASNPVRLGIAIYGSGGLLPLTDGSGDWNGFRHLFDLKWEPPTD